MCRSQPVILTEVVTTHKFLQLDGLGPWWAYGTYSHQGPSCGVLVVMGISQCLQFWWACTHRQVLRGILHNQCSCTHTLDPDSSMTAFDPGMSLNCLHSHCAMVPVSAAHVIWQALAAYAVAGPCLTQACRELPAPVPQGCGVVVGDLQFMYIATLVALTAGIVVPFSPTHLPFPGLLLVGSPLGQQPRRQQHRLLHMMGVSATMCSCLAGWLQQ